MTHAKAINPTIQEPIVLVGKQVSVSDIATASRDYLVGVACFEGASLSHVAILASALGIEVDQFFFENGSMLEKLDVSLNELETLITGSPSSTPRSIACLKC